MDGTGGGRGAVQEETLSVRIFVFEEGRLLDDPDTLLSYALQFNEVEMPSCALASLRPQPTFHSHFPLSSHFIFLALGTENWELLCAGIYRQITPGNPIIPSTTPSSYYFTDPPTLIPSWPAFR
jgi:hypothetical protein